MKIGVLSDTHVPTRASSLPSEVIQAFQHVDLILHAGDFVSVEIYERLMRLAPVEAVAGNMDHPEISRMLPSQREIEVSGKMIGLTHGWGGPWDLPQRVCGRFRPEIDCIVFGHSHTPYYSKEGRTLLFNPGSPVSDSNRSYGLLTVDEGRISGEIIHF
jgi:putative phosphoesterase